MEYKSQELIHWALQAKEEENLLLSWLKTGVGTTCDTIVNEVRKLRRNYYDCGMQKKLRPLYKRMSSLWSQHEDVLDEQGVFQAHDRLTRQEFVLDPETDDFEGYFLTVVNSVRLNFDVENLATFVPAHTPIQIFRHRFSREIFHIAVPLGSQSNAVIPLCGELHLFPAGGILIERDDYLSS